MALTCVPSCDGRLLESRWRAAPIKLMATTDGSEFACSPTSLSTLMVVAARLRRDFHIEARAQTAREAVSSAMLKRLSGPVPSLRATRHPRAATSIGPGFPKFHYAANSDLDGVRTADPAILSRPP